MQDEATKLVPSLGIGPSRILPPLSHMKKLAPMAMIEVILSQIFNPNKLSNLRMSTADDSNSSTTKKILEFLSCVVKVVCAKKFKIGLKMSPMNPVMKKIILLMPVLLS